MKTRNAVIVVAALALLLSGCSQESIHPTSPEMGSTVTADTSGSGILRLPSEPMALYSGDWTNNVLSEARYALSRSRSGASSLTRAGQYMGDWNYVSGGTDNGALQKLVAKYTGPSGTGTYGFSTYGQGGWCIFFADLVLYRSSYGLGGGYHLTLPGGYSYATTNPRSAGSGWILQSPMPHTAIIDAPYILGGRQVGWWVIDANWIGTWYEYTSTGSVRTVHNSFWIGKHAMTFESLDANRFKAWKPNLIRAF